MRIIRVLWWRVSYSEKKRMTIGISKTRESSLFKTLGLKTRVAAMATEKGVKSKHLMMESSYVALVTKLFWWALSKNADGPKTEANTFEN